MAVLLTRDAFREGVFARDKHTCVVCRQPGVDAHHIIERRLWPDGGYYLDNGATLCAVCHLKAESTELSCETIRASAGIERVALPPHLYPDTRYDKWGNVIMENGQRLRGDLFDDESVQKVLKPVLHEFTTRVKYPRTWHLPWSPGFTSDDRVMPTDDSFFPAEQSVEVVVTTKMDGENTTMYRDYMHARSIDGRHRDDQAFVRNLHAKIAHEIPENWRVCGENLYAAHSLKYTALPSYFMVYSVWNGLTCLSWDETVEWCELLGLQTVPMLWRGHYVSQKMLEQDIAESFKRDTFGAPENEGYVMRWSRSFPLRQFSQAVGKYVRKNHVTTHGHWTRRIIEVNGLR